jgi:hypothetical protein
MACREEDVMRHRSLVLLLSLVMLTACATLVGEARVAKHRPARRVVVVQPGWPLRRPPRHVMVHPDRVVVRVAPRVFLPPIVFVNVVVHARPPHEHITWEDGETITRDEDWREVILDCDATGSRLWYEIEDGRLEGDWAEVVFADGSAQVVDLATTTQGVGLYPLLDLRGPRHVDHVRLVLRARSRECRFVLRIEH